MKVNVYESIRFHALHKRRQHATKPARVMMGMAALAILIVSSVGALHGTATNPGPGTDAHYGANAGR